MYVNKIAESLSPGVKTCYPASQNTSMKMCTSIVENFFSLKHAKSSKNEEIANF